jgi:hypothetical protein
MYWWTQYTKPQPLHSPKAEEYIQIILGTNFTCNSAISHVASLLDLPVSPYIAVGTFADVAYRLIPNPRVLVKDKTSACGSIGLATPLPSIFLGINFNIDRRPEDKEDIISRQGDASAYSVDTHITGFPFFQLGHLEYFPRDPKHFNKSNLFSNEWEDAGFGVGIRLSSTGGHKGVYIFFNF